jgi:hypothetical protein
MSHEQDAGAYDRRLQHPRTGLYRRELNIFFSTVPSVAEGFQLKTWRGGSDAGKPKLSPIAKGLIGVA